MYYFKFTSVKQIFQQSQIEIATSKTIFTHQIYQVCEENLETYFNVFAQGASAVDAEPSDLGPQVDYHSLLGQKAGRNTVAFTAESHASKLGLLLPSLHRFISKNIQSMDPEQR